MSTASVIAYTDISRIADQLASLWNWQRGHVLKVMCRELGLRSWRSNPEMALTWLQEEHAKAEADEQELRALTAWMLAGGLDDQPSVVDVTVEVYGERAAEKASEDGAQ